MADEGAAVRRPARRAARGLVLLGAAWFVVAYVVVALLRLRSPFELEWMEGGVVDHVRQVLAGHQLYRPPSLTFTPYLYTPLYYYVAAVPSRLLGVGYVPLRLVSLVSSLAALATIAWWVAKETGDRWAGAVAAGLFAACFRIGGAWFDLARVDSLFLALLLGGLAGARFARSTRAATGAAVLLVLATLTKQEALLPAAAVLPFLWRTDRRLGLRFAATFAVLLGASVALLQATSGGWFLYYVVQVPLAHRLLGAEARTFWTVDLAHVAPAAVLAAIGLVVGHRRGRPVPAWFYGPVVAAMVAAAWSGRIHSGGYDNVLLPAYAVVAVLGGVGVAALLPRVAPVGGRRGLPAWPAAVALGLVALQLALLAYDPTAALPRPSEARRVDALLAELRSLPGPVYLPGHGWYLTRAGRTGGAQTAAMEDVLRGPGGAGKDDLRRALARLVAERRFGSVVVDAMPSLSTLPPGFARYYCRSHRLFTGHGPGAGLLPVTGTATGPLTVWLPRATPLAKDPTPHLDCPVTAAPAT